MKGIPHKKVAVDFDNTLFHTEGFPNVGKQRFVNRIVASYIRHLHRRGWIVILNTMREPGKGLEEAIAACAAFHIPINYVNENYPPDVQTYGESRKIGCQLSIDDTQVGLIGWILRHFG